MGVEVSEKPCWVLGEKGDKTQDEVGIRGRIGVGRGQS
jgi:hypothetical protein